MRATEIFEDDWHGEGDAWHGAGNDPKDAWYSPDGAGAAVGGGLGADVELDEAPIDMDPANPNNPTIYGHDKANPMQLQSRIAQSRAQLKELAQLADSNDLVVWEKIAKLALGGGITMGLVQNLGQVQHGIQELVAQRKKGGIASRGIDKNIG